MKQHSHHTAQGICERIVLIENALFFDWLIEAEWRVYASVNYAIIDSDNGLSPDRRQPIIWTNDGLLSMWP